MINKEKIINGFNNKKGYSMLSTCLVILIFSIIIAGTTSWYLSFKKGLDNASDNLMVVNEAYDEWNKILNGDFYEQVEKYAGTTQKRNGNNDLVIETTYSKEGTFGNDGSCEVGATASLKETACMNTTIVVKDKTGKELYKMSPTKVKSRGTAVINDSYINHNRISLKYEQKQNNEGSLEYNTNGTPKMILQGYVDGNKVDFGSSISVDVLGFASEESGHFSYYSHCFSDSGSPRIGHIEVIDFYVEKDGEYFINTTYKWDGITNKFGGRTIQGNYGLYIDGVGYWGFSAAAEGPYLPNEAYSITIPMRGRAKLKKGWHKAQATAYAHRWHYTPITSFAIDGSVGVINKNGKKYYFKVSAVI